MNLYSYTIFCNGRELEDLNAGVFATEAEAQEEADQFVATRLAPEASRGLITVRVGVAARTEDVPDGDYYIFAEGSGWEMYRYSGGKMVGGCDESNMGTHCAAGDMWAECDAALATKEVGLTISIAVANWDVEEGRSGRDMSMITVMRVPAVK